MTEKQSQIGEVDSKAPDAKSEHLEKAQKALVVAYLWGLGTVLTLTSSIKLIDTATETQNYFLIPQILIFSLASAVNGVNTVMRIHEHIRQTDLANEHKE